MTDEFPDDSNGDVLRQLRLLGDSLTESRDVDFSVIFPTENVGATFCRQLDNLGYRTKLGQIEYAGRTYSDVTVIVNMVPAHSGVTALEAKLSSLAEPLGGRNDGWVCEAIGADRLTKQYATQGEANNLRPRAEGQNRP